MSESAELSIVTVVALVLGGIAAVVLAVAVATKDARRADPGGIRAESSVGVPSGAPVVVAAPSPSAEVEVPAELLYPVESDAPSDPR